MPAPPRVHVLTLGCPKNEVDSDRMAARIASSAYDLTEDVERADVAILNTCAFIEAATQESVDTALALAADWKAAEPGRTLVLTGCLPSRYGDALAEAMPEADAFLPVADEGSILDVLERLTGIPARATEGPERLAATPSAYLQIADGCHRRCSYCTIPAIRGPYRSRPLAQLAEEARLLVAAGTRELVLVGQDTSSYGSDLADDRGASRAPTLARAIDHLARTSGAAWLRVMYVQPDGVTDELLEVMASHDNVCRYLDVPLQHSSAEVLREMGRAGDAETFLALLERIRGVMPDVVLRTSLIAGFPGETERDLAGLEAFLREAAFDYAGVFAYSPEDGTRAAAMPGLPPARERARRARGLTELAEEIGFQRVAGRVGTTVEVLAEGSDPDAGPTGRWRGQAPDVDGVVTFDASLRPGTIARVRVTDTMGFDLVGEVCA